MAIALIAIASAEIPHHNPRCLIIFSRIFFWLLVIGYWLFVVGYWLFVVGYWLFVVGCWLFVVSSRVTGDG
ncbi:MAG: hypothetical protein AB4290_21870 [Spirulina sp.]